MTDELTAADYFRHKAIADDLKLPVEMVATVAPTHELTETLFNRVSKAQEPRRKWGLPAAQGALILFLCAILNLNDGNDQNFTSPIEAGGILLVYGLVCAHLSDRKLKEIADTTLRKAHANLPASQATLAGDNKLAYFSASPP